MKRKKFLKLNFDQDDQFHYYDDDLTGPIRPGNAFYQWLGRGNIPLHVPMPDTLIVGYPPHYNGSEGAGDASSPSSVKLVWYDFKKQLLQSTFGHFNSQDQRDQFYDLVYDRFFVANSLKTASKSANDGIKEHKRASSASSRTVREREDEEREREREAQSAMSSAPLFNRFVAIQKRTVVPKLGNSSSNSNNAKKESVPSEETNAFNYGSDKSYDRRNTHQQCETVLSFALQAMLFDIFDSNSSGSAEEGSGGGAGGSGSAGGTFVVQRFIKSRGRRPSIYRVFWRNGSGDLGLAEGWNIAKTEEEFVLPELVRSGSSNNNNNNNTNTNNTISNTSSNINTSNSNVSIAGKSSTAGQSGSKAVRAPSLATATATQTATGTETASATEAVTLSQRQAQAQSNSAEEEFNRLTTKLVTDILLQGQRMLRSNAHSGSAHNNSSSGKSGKVLRAPAGKTAGKTAGALQRVVSADSPPAAKNKPQSAQQANARRNSNADNLSAEMTKKTIVANLLQSSAEQLDEYFLKGLKHQQHMSSNERTDAMTINSKVSQRFLNAITTSISKNATGELSDEKCAKLMVTRVSNSALSTPIAYLVETARWMQHTLIQLHNVNVTICDLVCDFIRDDDDRWFLVNIKGFRIAPECVPRVRLWFHTQVLRRPERELVKTHTLTARERALKHEAQQGTLCRLCGVYYVENSYVYLPMTAKTDSLFARMEREKQRHSHYQPGDEIISAQPALLDLPPRPRPSSAATSAAVGTPGNDTHTNTEIDRDAEIEGERLLPTPVFGYQLTMQAATEVALVYFRRSLPLSRLAQQLLENTHKRASRTRSVRLAQESTRTEDAVALQGIAGELLACCYYCKEIYERSQAIVRASRRLYDLLGVEREKEPEREGDSEHTHTRNGVSVEETMKSPLSLAFALKGSKKEKERERESALLTASLSSASVLSISRPQSACSTRSLAYNKANRNNKSVTMEARPLSASKERGRESEFVSFLRAVQRLSPWASQCRDAGVDLLQALSAQHRETAAHYLSFHSLPRGVRYWRLLSLSHCLVLSPQTHNTHSTGREGSVERDCVLPDYLCVTYSLGQSVVHIPFATRSRSSSSPLRPGSPSRRPLSPSSPYRNAHLVREMQREREQLREKVLPIEECRVHSLFATKKDLLRFLREKEIVFSLYSSAYEERRNAFGAAAREREREAEMETEQEKKRERARRPQSAPLSRIHQRTYLSSSPAPASPSALSHINDSSCNERKERENTAPLKERGRGTENARSRPLLEAQCVVSLKTLRLSTDDTTLSSGLEKTDIVVVFPSLSLGAVCLRLSFSLAMSDTLPDELGEQGSFYREREGVFWPPAAFAPPRVPLPTSWLCMLTTQTHTQTRREAESASLVNAQHAHVDLEDSEGENDIADNSLLNLLDDELLKEEKIITAEMRRLQEKAKRNKLLRQTNTTQPQTHTQIQTSSRRKSVLQQSIAFDQTLRSADASLAISPSLGAPKFTSQRTQSHLDVLLEEETAAKEKQQQQARRASLLQNVVMPGKTSFRRASVSPSARPSSPLPVDRSLVALQHVLEDEERGREIERDAQRERAQAEEEEREQQRWENAQRHLSTQSIRRASTMLIAQTRGRPLDAEKEVQSIHGSGSRSATINELFSSLRIAEEAPPPLILQPAPQQSPYTHPSTRTTSVHGPVNTHSSAESSYPTVLHAHAEGIETLMHLFDERVRFEEERELGRRRARHRAKQRFLRFEEKQATREDEYSERENESRDEGQKDEPREQEEDNGNTSTDDDDDDDDDDTSTDESGSLSSQDSELQRRRRSSAALSERERLIETQCTFCADLSKLCILRAKPLLESLLKIVFLVTQQYSHHLSTGCDNASSSSLSPVIASRRDKSSMVRTDDGVAKRKSTLSESTETESSTPAREIPIHRKTLSSFVVRDAALESFQTALLQRIEEEDEEDDGPAVRVEDHQWRCLNEELLESMSLALKNLLIFDYLPSHLNWTLLRPLIIENLRIFVAEKKL